MTLSDLLNQLPLELRDYYEQEKALIRQTFLLGIHWLRAHPPAFDEKLHAIFYQRGINSGSAQHEIFEYFKMENEYFQKYQILPNWDFTEVFLEQVTFKYRGCIEASLIKRGVLGKLGYDGLKNKEPTHEGQSTKRKKLSSGSRRVHKSGGDGSLQVSGTRRKNGRNNVQATPSATPNDTSRPADLWTGSGKTATDSNPKREGRKTRLLTNVS